MSNKTHLHQPGRTELRKQIEVLLAANRILAPALEAAQNEMAIIANLTDRVKIGNGKTASGVALAFASGRIIDEVHGIAKNWRDKPPVRFDRPTTVLANGKAAPGQPTVKHLIKAIEDEPVDSKKI